VASLPESLQQALEDALAGIPARELARSVSSLTDRYRSGQPASAPILTSVTEVAAYAAYRMPATYAACRAALTQFAALAADFRPRTQADLGGGTGAAVWAAADVWPSLQLIEVLEREPKVIELGQRLASAAPNPAVRAASWRPLVLGPKAAIPHADLVTMSYVLGELSEADRRGVIRELTNCAEAVALVEPGTPAGYARLIAARSTLIEAGLTIVAPCPHDQQCPLSPGRDWCHFATRINRTSVHRRLKGGSLGYEDEKFCYLVAARTRWPHADSRILRRPQHRKGAVTMTLCAGDPGLATETVFRRDKDLYRPARTVGWGDAWPPLPDDEVDSLG
jgi:ribosomal protein RSM22 (predicted rRNA methylase)